MDDLTALLDRYHAGERLDFGPDVALHQGVLHLPGHSLPLNTLEPLVRDDAGAAAVHRIGADDAPLAVPAPSLDDLDLFIAVANHLIAAIPYVKRRSVTGWPPGSIGDISARIGYDVRDLMVAGYSEDQIQGLQNGQYTLDDLLSQKPGRAAGP
jgi:hypothetical protein